MTEAEDAQRTTMQQLREMGLSTLASDAKQLHSFETAKVDVIDFDAKDLDLAMRRYFRTYFMCMTTTQVKDYIKDRYQLKSDTGLGPHYKRRMFKAFSNVETLFDEVIIRHLRRSDRDDASSSNWTVGHSGNNWCGWLRCGRDDNSGAISGARKSTMVMSPNQAPATESSSALRKQLRAGRSFPEAFLRTELPALIDSRECVAWKPPVQEGGGGGKDDTAKPYGQRPVQQDGSAWHMLSPVEDTDSTIVEDRYRQSRSTSMDDDKHASIRPMVHGTGLDDMPVESVSPEGSQTPSISSISEGQAPKEQRNISIKLTARSKAHKVHQQLVRPADQCIRGREFTPAVAAAIKKRWDELCVSMMLVQHRIQKEAHTSFYDRRRAVAVDWAHESRLFRSAKEKHRMLGLAPEDDVDLLLFMVKHCVSPIRLSLLISYKYTQLHNRSLADMDKHKATLFATLAQELTDMLPLGVTFDMERAYTLGPVANAPLELALYHGDADFVAKDAVQAYADDVWGNPSTSPFTGHGLYLSVSQPFDFLCTSVRARRWMYSLSFIGFGLVLWLTLEASRQRGELDSSLTLLDMGLYFFALAKVITEVVECAGELDQAQVEFGSETIMKQVEHGFQRYIRLDPWNVLDVIVAIGFCGIFVVRLIGVDHELVFLASTVMMIPSFLRVLQVFEMHRVLGPLVRSMVNMATDIATFLVLCAVFLSAFTITFTLFFSQVNAAYSTYVDSLLTLFAASLGDFDYDLHADESHPMRSRLGTVLLTLHIVASHIILLNLIVAIMGSTYEFFKENSTKEYKFGRARTIYNSANAVIHYRVPPPLNMLKVPCLLLLRLFDVLPKCIRPSRKRRNHIMYAYTDTLMVVTFWPPLLAWYLVTRLFGMVFSAVGYSMTLSAGLLQATLRCLRVRTLAAKRASMAALEIVRTSSTATDSHTNKPAQAWKAASLHDSGHPLHVESYARSLASLKRLEQKMRPQCIHLVDTTEELNRTAGCISPQPDGPELQLQQTALPRLDSSVAQDDVDGGSDKRVLPVLGGRQRSGGRSRCTLTRVFCCPCYVLVVVFRKCRRSCSRMTVTSPYRDQLERRLGKARMRVTHAVMVLDTSSHLQRTTYYDFGRPHKHATRLEARRDAGDEHSRPVPPLQQKSVAGGDTHRTIHARGYEVSMSLMLRELEQNETLEEAVSLSDIVDFVPDARAHVASDGAMEIPLIFSEHWLRSCRDKIGAISRQLRAKIARRDDEDISSVDC